jgi:hypothetical protein
MCHSLTTINNLHSETVEHHFNNKIIFEIFVTLFNFIALEKALLPL